MRCGHILSVFSLGLLGASQEIASDSGVLGPPLELVHVYNDEFPTGVLRLTSGLPCGAIH